MTLEKFAKMGGIIYDDPQNPHLWIHKHFDGYRLYARDDYVGTFASYADILPKLKDMRDNVDGLFEYTCISRLIAVVESDIL